MTASISCFAIAKETSEKRLYRLLSPIEGFSAKFTQQLLDPQGEILQTLSGVLHAQKPDKVHWAVFDPAAQKIISNGTRLWIYDPDLEQVIIEPYSNNPEANPISLLLGNLQQLNENFQLVAQSKASGSEQWFTLKPMQSNALYSKVKIEFKGQTLSAISFTNNFGQTTQLALINFELNPIFDNELFNFKAPKGVDIVNHVR